MEIKGHPECYASPEQREVLAHLIEHPVIQENFFLTGETALAVFYLHHRVSNDLDLFSRKEVDMGKLAFWTKTRWPRESARLLEAPRILSVLVRDVKVDLVIDPLSTEEKRDRYRFENDRFLAVDSLKSIASNKLSAMVGRTEPKDFVDFFTLATSAPSFDLKDIFRLAREKDAIFDDPPSAAFQLESGIEFVKRNPSIRPAMMKEIDWEAFFAYFEDLAAWLYKRIDPA